MHLLADAQVNYIKQNFVASHPDNPWEDKLNEFAQQHTHLPNLRLVSVIARPHNHADTGNMTFYNAVWEF